MALSLFPKERLHGYGEGGCELAEGPEWRVELSPGTVAVRSSDPARGDRRHERESAGARSMASLLAGKLLEQADYRLPAGVSRVRVWSAKSRAKMLERLRQLDYVAAGWPTGDVGMVTLTYPGDWLTVAPGPDACRAHLAKFRRRWERKWGPLSAVWKREFQRRGAPHYHLGCVIPDSPEFPSWLSATWAEIVAHPDPEERARHRLAGTGIDYDKGARSTDPMRFAAYFAKHGLFTAKGYQNDPPAEWASEEGVGRFWGYWRLRPLVLAGPIAPDVARSTIRTARRWHESKKQRATVYRWRKVTTVDPETGELGWKWRRRRTSIRVRRLTRSAGFLAVPDGSAVGVLLARVATAETQKRPSRASGAGPVGFLP